MNRKNIYSTILALFAINMVYGQMAQDRMHYIAKFSKIAQEEMERTGVPASIKLAQAILESNGGKSVLSRKANNHFGIKCGGNWNDRSFYRVDDEKDSKGNDIESCFRVYKNAESSFIAHSEFLRSNKRYEFLFSLAHDDYKGWAHGLKKAGYATNPKYPSLLIKVVEDYSLFQYDDLYVPEDDAMVVTTDEDMYFEELAKQQKERARMQTQKATKTGKLNDINVVFADAHETPEIIAAKTDVPLRRIFKYNESLTDPSQDLPENTIIFLQPKRKAYRGRKKFHKVNEGETIAQISQKYGIRIDKLLLRNRLSDNEEPLPGAILKIKGRKVAANSRIPTREVGLASNAKEVKNKQSQKFATALSDFELPPSVEEERKIERKQKTLRLKQNTQTQEEEVSSTPIVKRIEKSKTSTSSYLEESKDANSVYRAPISSDNYNTYDSSSNAKFKEEKSSPSEPVRADSNDGTAIQATTSTTTAVTSPTTSSPTTNLETRPSVPNATVGSPTVTTASSGPVVTNPATITTIQAVETRYHVVEKGQTLYRLSKIYGKSVDYIKQVNGLTSNTISIGQKLIVN